VAVAPGYVDTPVLAPDQLKNCNPSSCANRLASAEEIASVIVFLLSDLASFMTGSLHLADGGYIAR